MQKTRCLANSFTDKALFAIESLEQEPLTKLNLLPQMTPVEFPAGTRSMEMFAYHFVVQTRAGRGKYLSFIWKGTTGSQLVSTAHAKANNLETSTSDW